MIIMKIDDCEIFIAINNPNPDFEDFAKARSKLDLLGIDPEGVGILLTKFQWVHFQQNMSRFESRMVSPADLPKTIMGFPVKIVEFFIEEKL